MNTNRLCSLAAGLICAAWLVAAASAQVTKKRNNLNISTQGNAERCADLKVTSNGELVQSVDTFTLTRAEAPVLEMTGVDRGVLRVRGLDRAEYSVEACKIAV